MTRSETTIKQDILRSEIAMRVETFERDLTVIGGLLVLTPLIIILLSEVFNTSLIYMTIPLLTLLTLMLIFTVDRDVENMLIILLNFNPKIVKSYEKFKNRLFQIYESLNDDEKILFKYSICNRLAGSDKNDVLAHVIDLGLDLSRRDVSDVRTIENLRKFIITELRRLVYRFSTLLMVCMLSLGILAPLLYSILSKELIGRVNMIPLALCIVPTLVIYVYLCFRICKKIENVGIERTLTRIRRNCFITFLLSLICLMLIMFLF
ncbi:MAG: hypothetical protein GXO10_02800 [Crenarchaeota archaeon]|nr:hypothetical protein [Thermoproteota archaeon]